MLHHVTFRRVEELRTDTYSDQSSQDLPIRCSQFQEMGMQHAVGTLQLLQRTHLASLEEEDAIQLRQEGVQILQDTLGNRLHLVGVVVTDKGIR